MSTSTSITSLFQDAHAEGAIGAQSLQLLMPFDLNGQLQGALGMSAGEIPATEVTLVSIMIDDSVSMEPMEDEARSALTLMKQALGGSKNAPGVMMAAWTFDPQPIHGFQSLLNVPDLDANTYRAHRSNTPLYDGTLRMLAAVLAKTQEFASNGVPVRSVSVIVTDGANNASKHSATNVATVVADLERSEMHLVLFIGIDDGDTDFLQVGREMGIHPDRIKTVKDSPHELRQAIHAASQSALQVSQTAGTISQVGFGAV